MPSKAKLANKVLASQFKEIFQKLNVDITILTTEDIFKIAEIPLEETLEPGSFQLIFTNIPTESLNKNYALKIFKEVILI